MAEIDLDCRDLKTGLPSLCMLCGQTEAEPQVPVTLGPVPKLLKVFAPLVNALHPSRVWLKAPMCPTCHRGFKQHTLMTWGAIAIIVVAAVMGIGGLAHGMPIPSSLFWLGLAVAMPILYLIWTSGPGKACHIHCNRVNLACITVQLSNIEFPKAYTAMKRGERMEKIMMGPSTPALPTIVEQPEIVEKEPDARCPFLRGEELAKIPSELSPFLAAVKEGEFEKVAKLLKAGASWEETTPEGLSAIHIGTLVGAPDIVAELVGLGQSLHATYGPGLTPIFLAVQCNYTQLLGFMLARKVNPNSTNDDGQTPLHWACGSADLRLIGPSRFKICKQLLAAGADPSIKDKEGRTPGDMATEMNHIEAMEALGLKEVVKPNDDGAPDQSLFRPVAWRPDEPESVNS